MRMAREASDLTQTGLARRLECSQQAVGQAERWDSNPTVEFMRRWAKACGATLGIDIRPASRG
jgi:DNA-binding XRE family transcriptional regulator